MAENEKAVGQGPNPASLDALNEPSGAVGTEHEPAPEEDGLDPDDSGEGESAGGDEEKAMAELREAIGVVKEDVGPLRVKLTVTVPREFLDGRMSKEYADLRRDAVIPGFRKGRAPLKLVEKRFAADVGDQLKTQLVSSGYLAAAEKESLDPIGDPLFWVKVKEQRRGEEPGSPQAGSEKLVPIQQATDLIEWPKDGPLTFSCEVELRPKFELPSLEGIPLVRPDVSVTDADVQERIDHLLSLRGTLQPVEQGGIEPDDLLYGDIRVTVGDREILADSSADLAARDSWWKGLPLKGFGSASKGKKAGESIETDVTFPEDYPELELRGTTGKVTFKVQEIKRIAPAVLNEAFLESIGYDSEQELRDGFRRNLEARQEQALRERLREQVGNYLVDHTPFEIPEGVSARQTERTLARRMIQLLQAGVPEATVRKSVDTMRDKARDQVARDLKLFFILEKIAELREVEVPEERLNAAIADIARQSDKRFDRVRDELLRGEGMTSLYLQIRDEMVLDELIRDASISVEVGPKTV